jgi:small-conductance mechanosensitive channel
MRPYRIGDRVRVGEGVTGAVAAYRLSDSTQTLTVTIPEGLVVIVVDLATGTHERRL